MRSINHKRGSSSRLPLSGRRPSRGVTGTSLPTIRILVAEDQAIDRAGMIAILRSQPDFAIAGEVSSAEEAIRALADTKPSLILLSLQIPAPDGETALSAIRSLSPGIPILAVSERGKARCMVLNPPRRGHPTATEPKANCTVGLDCLQLAVAEGATGTIRRSSAPEDLFRAIRAIASGKSWYESETAAAIMRHALARRGGGETQRPLSEREIDVSELIADGRSNKEIAQALGISEPTVKKHVGHVLAKLKLQDRLQVGLHIARNPLLLRATGRPPR